MRRRSGPAYQTFARGYDEDEDGGVLAELGVSEHTIVLAALFTIGLIYWSVSSFGDVSVSMR